MSDEKIWVCERCGSEDVECEAWVRLNPPHQFVDKPSLWDLWCPDCDAEVGVVESGGEI